LNFIEYIIKKQKIRSKKVKFMITCVNKECQNFGQELDDNIEVCPICGTKTEQSKTKKGGSSATNLGIVCCLAALVGAVIFWFSYGFVMWIGVAVTVASVVVAFISKKLFAIIFTIICVAAIILLEIALITGLIVW